MTSPSSAVIPITAKLTWGKDTRRDTVEARFRKWLGKKSIPKDTQKAIVDRGNADGRR